MRRFAVAAALLCFGATAALYVAASTPTLHSDRGEPVAFVNGTPITSASFERYASVFTNPRGTLEVSREDVLVSLINQTLVSEFADKAGIEVPHEIVEARMSALEAEWRVEGLGRPGGRRALQARVRALIMFERVKAVVIGTRTTPDADNRERTAMAWAGWLEGERACATIVVLDASVQVPSSTPNPQCVGP